MVFSIPRVFGGICSKINNFLTSVRRKVSVYKETKPMFSLQKRTCISQFNSSLFLTCPKWFPQTFLSHLSPINKQYHCFNFSLWNTFRLRNICKNCGKKRIPYTLYVLYQTSPKVNLLLNHSPIIKTTLHIILAPHLQILFKFHPQSQVQSRTTHYNSCPVSLCAQFSSVAQLCLTLCDAMNHSTPGLPVHHQLLESTQTHVHWVGDAIQPSHPLSSLSPPALNLSQHQGLFKWVRFSHKVLSCIQLLATPWTLAHQSPLSMGFSKQEYWSGFPCPPPGDLLNPGIKPKSLVYPALQEDSLRLEPTGKSNQSLQFSSVQ